MRTRNGSRTHYIRLFKRTEHTTVFCCCFLIFCARSVRFISFHRSRSRPCGSHPAALCSVLSSFSQTNRRQTNEKLCSQQAHGKSQTKKLLLLYFVFLLFRRPELNAKFEYDLAWFLWFGCWRGFRGRRDISLY